MCAALRHIIETTNPDAWLGLALLAAFLLSAIMMLDIENDNRR